MAPYHPPAEGREGKLRLDFNENTVGCSPNVAEFLRQAITADALTIYPEYSGARTELAQFFNVTEDQFLITNGTDEAIQILVNTYINEGDEVMIQQPSYAMYRFYTESAGANVGQALSPATKAVLIANPNNPTGAALDLGAIRQVLESTPKAAVLIDEAYYEFHGETVLPWIGHYPNLFVSRTFSKAYGMAAMRVGCIFSNAENISWLRKAQSPYSVNALAALAARAAIRDTEYVKAYAAEVIAARQQAAEGLESLGIQYIPSRANFILFNAGDRAIEIRDILRDRAILIRDRSYEIPGHLRVTIGNREQTARFLTELETAWKR